MRVFSTLAMMLVAILISGFLNLILAQNDEIETIECGYDIHQEYLKNKNPDYLKEQKQNDLSFSSFVKNNNATGSKNNVLVTIPVVIHIIHDGVPIGSPTNPNDNELQELVEETTMRFRQMQAGAPSFNNPFYGVDTEIEFCLASVDPSGNYSNGITRQYNANLSTGEISDLITGLDALKWDPSKYCNLFTVTDLTDAAGVYIGGRDFMIFNTATIWSGLAAHEIGHYFNLRHTFQGACTNNDCTLDGDGVCDTPPKAESGRSGNSCGAPADSCTNDEDDTSDNNPYRSVAMGGMGNQVDMYANYMDYTGSCWSSFTVGQKERMHFNIMTNRIGMVENATVICQESETPAYDLGISNIALNRADICTNYFNPTVKLTNHGSETLQNAVIKLSLNNQVYISQSWNGNLEPNDSETIQISEVVYVEPGEYLLGISVDTEEGNDAYAFNNIDYAKFDYIGGINCINFNGCSTMNPETSLGNGNKTVVQIDANWNDYTINNDVTICVSAQGDISSSSEVFIVLDEDGADRGLTNSNGDCRGLSPEYCFSVEVDRFNSWVADGNITIEFDPIAATINPSLCNINEVCAAVYLPLGEISSTVDINYSPFLISPNPAKDFITLHGTNIKDASISIYDRIGRLISQSRMDIPSKIDVSNYEAGIYYMSIFDAIENTRFVNKMVILD